MTENSASKYSSGQPSGAASGPKTNAPQAKPSDALASASAAVSIIDAAGGLAKVGGWEVDLRTQALTWTRETYRIHEVPAGYTPSLEEDEAFRFYHPEDRPRLKQAFLRAAEHGEPYDMEIRFITYTGRRIWAHTICRPVLEDGRPVRLLGIFHDVTERKRIEARDRLMTEILELLNQPRPTRETIDEILHRLRVSLHCTTVALHIRRGDEFPLYLMSGKPPGGESDTPPQDGTRPGLAAASPSPQLHKDCLAAAALEGTLKAPGYERTQQGSYWCNNLKPLPPSERRDCNSCDLDGLCLAEAGRSLALIPLRIGGRAAGLLALQDVSPDRFSEKDLLFLERVALSLSTAQERLKLEAELRRHRDLMLQVEQVATLGFVDLDLETRAVNWSPEVYEIVGLERGAKQPTIESTLAFVAESDRAPLKKLILEASEHTTPFEFEFGILRPDGQARSILAKGHGTRGGAEQRPTLRFLIMDITARKKLETDLRQSHRMEALGQLAGGVAHDFNNLLTIIGGYGERLLDSLEAGSDQRAAALEVCGASERASNLTRQLLAFSRRQGLSPTVLDLNEVVLNVGKMLKRLIGENVCLRTDLADDLWPIRADRGQMEQVIVNLAVNARDAMESGGTLSIRTRNIPTDLLPARAANKMPELRQSPRLVALSVTDTGVGMDVTVCDRIFDPFFTTKAQGKGTGLGLSSVYGIVKQSGGQIDVMSERGEGTTFLIHMPALAEDVVKTPQIPAPLKAPAGHSRVLLVEDEPRVRRLSRTILERAGYEVLTARDGDDARALAARSKGRFDLLLTDVVMPGTGGIDLAEGLLAEDPTLRVLFMTGYMAETADDLAARIPGSRLLPKPFLPGTLLRSVSEALEGEEVVLASPPPQF